MQPTTTAAKSVWWHPHEGFVLVTDGHARFCAKTVADIAADCPVCVLFTMVMTYKCLICRPKKRCKRQIVIVRQ